MSKRTWSKIISFAALLGLCVYVLSTDRAAVLLSGDIDRIRELFGGNHLMLRIITLLLMVIQNLFTVIPLILLITLNVTLFGFWDGYLWSWLTSIAGGIVSFAASRFWFQDFFLRKINHKWKEQVEQGGFIMVFAGRVIPFIPTSAINIASGISSVKFRHFVSGTILGNAIFFFVMALIPLGIMTLETETLAGLTAAAAVLAVLAAAWFVNRRRRRKQKHAADEHVSS